MHNLRQYTRNMLAILLVYMLVLIAALFAVSSALARDATRRLAREEVSHALDTGLRLLGSPEAETAVNPALNPGEVFVILLDGEGVPFAMTEAAGDYLGRLSLPELTAALGPDAPTELTALPEVLLMGRQGEGGFALAGKALASSNLAMGGFRSLLLQYTLIAAVLMAVALVLLSWRINQPVDMLASAVQRISEGEQVQIIEKLPVELRPLGRGLNTLSHRLSRTLGELTYERDTLSQVLESLDEGVLAIDRQGDVLRENQAVARLLEGQGSAYYARVLACLRDAADSPREPLTLQIGERTVLAVFRPLAARAGALAVLRDVTEHERLERTRRDYVANITHELRTPLSTLRGITEGLRDGLVTEEKERQRYYELMLSEVKRLSRLVSDLLELSSLQSSPAAFALETVDPLETLYEAHDRAQTLAREKGVALTLRVPEALPPVCTNEDRLQQVLTILLDNAIKFTPAGGEVTLSAEQEARHVRFSVRDTGIGMDAYTLEHAFDRFHQADPSHGAKGSGLGLAIAREVMQRLGSRIVAHSEPGKGSEFSFLIRIQADETQQEA